MSIPVLILLVMTILGIVLGLLLAIADKKFAIEINPLIHIVEDILPKGQCGACGYAGCLAYAEAVVLNPEVSPSLCIPGKESVARQVAEMTGKTPEVIEPRIAQVRCAGSNEKAVRNYEYKGIKDCLAASLLLGGPKACSYGCLGLGTCAVACPFDAIVMSSAGLPVIMPEKCTGCGACEIACPKNVIKMMPLGAKVRVNCNSKDRGPIAKKACSVACIGCSLCAKNCPYEAIVIKDNLAYVDEKICMEKCSEATCLAKCPTKAIRPVVLGVVPGREVKDEPVKQEAVPAETVTE